MQHESRWRGESKPRPALELFLPSVLSVFFLFFFVSAAAAELDENSVQRCSPSCAPHRKPLLPLFFFVAGEHFSRQGKTRGNLRALW